MKQLFINIGFITILFAFTLNINYCKKNDTIEPEPVNNNPTVSGEYNNEITGYKLRQLHGLDYCFAGTKILL